MKGVNVYKVNIVAYIIILHALLEVQTTLKLKGA